MREILNTAMQLTHYSEAISFAGKDANQSGVFKSF